MRTEIEHYSPYDPCIGPAKGRKEKFKTCEPMEVIEGKADFQAVAPFRVKAPHFRPVFATIPPLSKQLLRAHARTGNTGAKRTMTRDETVALFLECEAERAAARAAAFGEGKDEGEVETLAHEAAKAHWNAWAEGQLATRKALEADRRWAAERDIHGRFDIKNYGHEPKNAETRAWMKAAEVDFSRCLFLVRGEEEAYKKETAGENREKSEDGKSPVKPIQFEGKNIDLPIKSIQLEGNNIDFSGFIFPGMARFERTTFSGPTSFISATFTGIASFYGAIFTNTGFGYAAFSSPASFVSATFSGTATFYSATFSGGAWFISATFSGHAGLDRVTFFNGAWFDYATFSGRAFFDSATFLYTASYLEAKFEKNTSFIGIRVDRDFDMNRAVFKRVPLFNQANFKQAPDLDDVEFPLPRFWRGGVGLRPESDLPSWHLVEPASSYRAIRRMAIQDSDHEREQMAFKGEVRSKRWTDQKPWHAGFWLGLAYDAFSDFGRSLWRPALAWALLVPLFSAYFLAQSGAIEDTGGLLGAVKDYARAAWSGFPSPPYCYPGASPRSYRPSVKRPDEVQTGLSGLVEEVRGRTSPVKEAFSIAYHNALVVLDNSGDSAHRAFGCLYGVERYGGSPVAFVPRGVAIASGVQKLLSAAFIFLFGLALRNMLKVK